VTKIGLRRDYDLTRRLTRAQTLSLRVRPEPVDDIVTQIRNDLTYLRLHHAVEVIDDLLTDARRRRWTPAKLLAEVLAAEAIATSDRRLQLRLKFAKFPVYRTLDDFDLDFQPSIDRELLTHVATLDFVEQGRSLLFLGQPGCGKTHLAIAIAIRAVEAGYSAYFTNAAQPAVHAGLCLANDETSRVEKTYANPRVLVVDDVGLTPFDRAGVNAMFHVINRRYELGLPTIVTTNRSLTAWPEVFGEPLIAAAILDRLLHGAHVFNIKGPSWRLKEHAGLLTGTG
jgi:DNA replication protein DnaC